MSSAIVPTAVVLHVCNSYVYNSKRERPSTLPCGTPERIGNIPQSVASTSILRCFKYNLMYVVYFATYEGIGVT